MTEVALHLSFSEDDPPDSIVELRGDVDELLRKVEYLQGLCSGEVVDIIAVRHVAKELEGLVAMVELNADSLTDTAVTA